MGGFLRVIHGLHRILRVDDVIPSHLLKLFFVKNRCLVYLGIYSWVNIPGISEKKISAQNADFRTRAISGSRCHIMNYNSDTLITNDLPTGEQQ